MKIGERALGAPFWFAVVVLVALPVILTMGLAFTDYNALSAPEWSGLDNIRAMIGDKIFRTAVWNSIIFVGIAVPLRVGAALGLALLYSRRRRGAQTGRALAYLPTVVPDVSYALLWLWVFNPIYGPLSLGMQAFGLPGPNLLLSAWGARSALAVVFAFQAGEGFIVALAARRSVPRELYELADVDGAGPWWTFRRVTWPQIAPVIAMLAARDVAVSLQANFIPALVLTNGGPFYATTFLPLHTYRTAFEFLQLGYASAMTLVMFAITASMVGVQLLIVRRWRVVQA